MRRGHHLGMSRQPGRDRPLHRRLRREHIQPSSGNPSLIQCLQQRFLVVHSPSCHTKQMSAICLCFGAVHNHHSSRNSEKKGRKTTYFKTLAVFFILLNSFSPTKFAVLANNGVCTVKKSTSANNPLNSPLNSTPTSFATASLPNNVSHMSPIRAATGAGSLRANPLPHPPNHPKRRQ